MFNTIVRKNRFGLEFVFKPMGHDVMATVLGAKDGDRYMVLKDVTLERLAVGWYCWDIKGEFIQIAFPYLSADEREFLLTGILPDEWKAMFAEEKER